MIVLPQKYFSDVRKTRRERLTPEKMVAGWANVNDVRRARKKAGLTAYCTPLEVAKDEPTSKRCAVYARCNDCQDEDGTDPGWLWAIGNCEVLDRPLYRHRPYQHKVGESPAGMCP